jgi:hypothetical protein
MHHLNARSRRALALLGIVLAGTATIAVPGVHAAILRTAGWALVVDEPVDRSDVVVVTSDAGPGGLLEAADLVHRGTATRVAVFSDPPGDAEREFTRRGVPYEDRAARSIRQLRFLGVANVEQIPQTVAGTENEGRVLPGWSAQRAFRSVVVVSTPDHSRRLRRVLRRVMKGHQTKVMVRVARYSDFDPDRWWQTRGGARIGIVELQKLLLDLALHPIS